MFYYKAKIKLKKKILGQSCHTHLFWCAHLILDTCQVLQRTISQVVFMVTDVGGVTFFNITFFFFFFRKAVVPGICIFVVKQFYTNIGLCDEVIFRTTLAAPQPLVCGRPNHEFKHICLDHEYSQSFICNPDRNNLYRHAKSDNFVDGFDSVLGVECMVDFFPSPAPPPTHSHTYTPPSYVIF